MMIRFKLLLAALFIAAIAGATASSPAESVCADAGATGVAPTSLRLKGGGVVIDPVCVWVP